MRHAENPPSKERNDRTIETGNSLGNRFEGFGWDIVLLFYVVLCCCPYTWQFDAPPLPSPPSGRVALSLNHFCCWAVGLLFPGQKEEGKKKKLGEVILQPILLTGLPWSNHVQIIDLLAPMNGENRPLVPDEPVEGFITPVIFYCLTPSIGIFGYNSVKSDGPPPIFQHNLQWFHGWNRTETLVWSEHEFEK